MLYEVITFRFTLAAFAAQGRDVKFAEERVEGYRHFVVITSYSIHYTKLYDDVRDKQLPLWCK